jgi:hypothetical protein
LLANGPLDRWVRSCGQSCDSVGQRSFAHGMMHFAKQPPRNVGRIFLGHLRTNPYIGH